MMKQAIACCTVISTMLMLSLSAVFACCSLQPAHFSSTKGFTGEALKDGKVVHLLGYQNTVANRVSGATATGNAMFLPIPAKPGTMTQQNVLDTTSCPRFMEDMENAIRDRLKGGRGLSRGGSLGVVPASFVVFEHDIYTVVLANNAEVIPEALKQVPAEKRPALNPAIFKAYAKWYPGWTFALCCFNTSQESQAKPLLWWYEPMYSERLFFPALDAHNGNPPNLGARVDVDHALIASSYKLNPSVASGTKPKVLKSGYPIYAVAHQVQYRDTSMSASLRKLLPDFAIGKQYSQQMPNGDFWFEADDVRRGIFDVKRELPPGAARTVSLTGPNSH